MTPKVFKTAGAFRISLEERLASAAQKQDVPVAALRMRVCFDRYLARMFALEKESWAMKGGYALELRWARTRTTKDMDMVLLDPKLRSLDRNEQAAAILQKLVLICRVDLNDYFYFEVRLNELITHATFGGARYKIKTIVANKEFCSFRMDIVLSEDDYEPETIAALDWLDFAGIEPPVIFAISKERQFAEKLHAYTYQWESRSNSRTKDLLDLYRLANGELNQDLLRLEVRRTFFVRNTHEKPHMLDLPDPDWEATFNLAVVESGLSLAMNQAYSDLASFYAKNLT